MPLLTPHFDLSQTHKHLVIKLRLPYVKVSKSEITILNNEFHFFLKPYSLKLVFQHQLQESEHPDKVFYDASQFLLTAEVKKLIPGEHFEELSMISQLLNKKRSKQQQKKYQIIQQIRKGQQLIEVVSSSEFPQTGPQEESKEQSPSLESVEKLMGQYKYGFNNQYSDVFTDLEEELLEIAILNPQFTPEEARIQLQRQQILEDFDKEHYLYDFLENEEIDIALQYEPNWPGANEFKYSIEEIKILETLPKTEFLIDNAQQINLQLLDILFALLYEQRVMGNELGGESASTINKISSTFSAFAVQHSAPEVMANSFERALCFPLLRSFEIAERVLADLCELLSQETHVLIKALIRIKQLFKHSEPRHLLNMLFIDDLIIYVQSKDFYRITLNELISGVTISKQDLTLGLETLEAQALSEFIQQNNEEAKDQQE